MIEFPYGIADFHSIRTQGMLYVDRTGHVRDVESLGRALVFLRPRRFGKSLWLRTMANYYDLRRRGEFRHLLTAIQETPYKLYLLIDEYDNFISEVMVHDPDTYRALVRTQGPFKELFKSVKAAMEGQGLDRVFVTGVSPIALNDLTSGFNVAKDVSLAPELATLCGFRETEIRELLDRIAEERALPPEVVDEAAETMRTWYNGYRFTDLPAERTAEDGGGEEELVYNPTNALYFLEHLYRRKAPPRNLHDENLRTDQGKLGFLARSSAGAGVIEELADRDDATVAVSRLETSFSLDDLTDRIAKDQDVVASFLYYLGWLTLTGDVPIRLKVPNLVVRRLFLDRLLEIFLPDPGDSYGAREAAMTFHQTGDLRPLAALFEERLLPVLSNRDRGRSPPRNGLSGGGANEMVVKSLFLSILFDDTRFVTFSEMELSKGYADLCLLVRPEMRRYGFFDVLFELKMVRLKELGRKGRDVAEMDEKALRRLPPVAKAFASARRQIERYSEALDRRFGEDLKLRSYTVVAVGLERLLVERISEI